MSKLIESIRQASKEATSKTQHEMTQEQLADIYFSGSEKAKKADYPLVIKVIEKPKSSSLLPWLITSIAFLITAFALFSTKRIFVDVKVIDDKNPYWAQSQMPAYPAAENFKQENHVIEDSRAGEKISLMDVEFEGAAKLNSSKDSSSLALVNSSVASFARANILPHPSINLSGKKIVFYAKGKYGGENLAFALKDKNNLPAFQKGKIYPFVNKLSTDWQRVEIMPSSFENEFDLTSVTSIRFEYGSKDTGSKAGDTVFVKDLQLLAV